MTEQIVDQKKMQEHSELRPIVLTRFGETLVKYPGSSDTEESELESVLAGVHAVCSGWIDKKAVSSNHFALICRNCGLRILVPDFVKTFAQLRGYCKQNRVTGVSSGL